MRACARVVRPRVVRARVVRSRVARARVARPRVVRARVARARVGSVTNVGLQRRTGSLSDTRRRMTTPKCACAHQCRPIVHRVLYRAFSAGPLHPTRKCRGPRAGWQCQADGSAPFASAVVGLPGADRAQRRVPQEGVDMQCMLIVPVESENDNSCVCIYQVCCRSTARRALPPPQCTVRVRLPFGALRCLLYVVLYATWHVARPPGRPRGGLRPRLLRSASRGRLSVRLA